MRKMSALIILLALSAFAQQPTDSRGWFQLGETKAAAGDHRGALDAYTKAAELGYVPRPILNIRIMRAYAHLGDKDKAFVILQQMARNGYGGINILNADDDLLALRADPRWKAAIAEMDHNSHPCISAPEFRQFDYWLGEWDVEIGGQKLAKSSVQIILDDCVIFENYTDSRGYAGKSFSLYDAANKKWEQRYVDTTGAFHTWTGGLDNGVMSFRWDYELNGQKSFNRMTYTKEGPDHVRQVLESSTDGKAWAKTYDGLYIRRK
jgi:tetratricopeptide (TPR) repeat protein